MKGYLDYENYQKGYKYLEITRQNIKDNIGKQIVYVDKKHYDGRRGYVFPRYEKIKSVYYSQIIFENYNSIYIKDILEMGIKIEIEEDENNNR